MVSVPSVSPRDSTAIYGRSRDWRSGAWPPGRQSEKAAAGADKGKQQPAARQGIVQRIRQNKAERHQGVKEKIQRNIEKAARVREPAPPRQSAVQAIQQAVKENGRQRRAIPPQRQKGQSQHADGKTNQRQPVR